MNLTICCPACGFSHKLSKRAVGKTVACLNCSAPMTVTRPDSVETDDLLLPVDDALPQLQNEGIPEGKEMEVIPLAKESESIPAVQEPSPEIEAPPRKRRKKSRKVDTASLPPLTTNGPPLWRRHLHWLLLLALIPLLVSLTKKSQDRSPLERLVDNLERLDPAERERVIKRLETAESLDDILTSFPDERLDGAFLRRTSKAHWVLAAGVTCLYLAFFMFLASDGSARPMHVLMVGLLTATIGVGFLLLVQALASLTEGRMIVGGGKLTIIFWILKFIAFSYSAALSPENGFLLSFLGFTLGVGLCEELIKAIPVFSYSEDESGPPWRGMMIWGLASGAGFGIAEGIMYSGRYYNGTAGPGIYLVRFISCVALHAIWSSSVGILCYLRRDMFENTHVWHEWIFPTVFVLAVPATLHGLYDTCLKKGMNGAAFAVAVASFGYLAFLLSRLQSGDDREANSEMLREYKRRRTVLE